MPVPTIAIITPSRGRTMGSELIEILGTGFRTPIIPDTIPAPVQPPTVKVYFGDVPALRVGVANDNRLLVFTPPHPEAVAGDSVAAVNVTVRNVDDDGEPIPGEEVTAASAFTYQLTSLHRVTRLQYLTRLIVQMLSERVHPEVIIAQHTDWDGAPDGTSIQPVGKLPAIVLDGPKIVENRFYSRNHVQAADVLHGEFVIKRERRTADFTFDVLLISDSTAEILNLSSVFTEFMHVTKSVAVPTDLSVPDVTDEFEFDFNPGGDFDWASEPNEHNLRQMRGSILVRGFDFIDGPGFSRGAPLGAKTGSPDVVLESAAQLPETTEDGSTVDLPVSGLPTRSPR